MLCDTHIHSKNSHDGNLPISKLVSIAKEKKIGYICITDHCDFDIDFGGCKAPVHFRSLNLERYYNNFVEAKKVIAEEDGLTMCFGIEASFLDDEKVIQKYVETINKYPFDAIINSVHCVNKKDVYFKTAFLFKTRHQIYSEYLATIRKSLDVPYPYEIVAHIGYIAHGAPYKDKALNYDEFKDQIDDILNTIIKKGKVLEINFHHEQCPPRQILERYYELGGRKVSYGGDSHNGEMCLHYPEVSKQLKEIGFTDYSVFVNHQEQLIPIE